MAVRKFKVVVDGKIHEVEVEDLGTVSTAKAPVSAASTVSQAPQAPAAPQTAAAAGKGTVNAPLQGTVNDVLVKEGQIVKAGENLVIIEAMKMENEIVAPQDGVVAKIFVHKGDKVSAGTPLVEIG